MLFCIDFSDCLCRVIFAADFNIYTYMYIRGNQFNFTSMICLPKIKPNLTQPHLISSSNNHNQSATAYSTA